MHWEVEGADYVLWRRVVEVAGDWAMASRLDAMHAARQSGCHTGLELPDGTVTRLPLMMVAEAAVAAHGGAEEEQWRERWVRALIELARDDARPAAINRVAALLNRMEAIILDMKAARVWPWLGLRAEGPCGGAPRPGS